LIGEKMELIVVGYKNDNPEEPVIDDIDVNEPKTEIDYKLSWEERNPLYEAREKEISDQVKAWADQNGLDKFGYTQRYGSYYYLAVSYDGPEDPDDKIIIITDDIMDRLRESLAKHDGNYMFLDGERVEFPLWRNKDKAANHEDAVKYLARAASECFPYSFSDENKAEMNEYAEKWGIPLDIDLLEQAGRLFNSYDSASWNTSSKYC